MDTVCQNRKCTGCNLCAAVCPQKCIHIYDHIEYINAIVDESNCIKCGLCSSLCPVNSPIKLQSQIECRQGWANYTPIRINASSGGAATAIAYEFIKGGGVVFGCVFKDGNFGFNEIVNIDQIETLHGSKYVKSNPKETYAKIREHIAKNHKLLFIGLPCQVAAVKNLTKNNKNLYTIDLICHGTPSPEILKQSLMQIGISLDEIDEIKFRNKQEFGITVNPKRTSQNKAVIDQYTTAFLNGINYTENCYECMYARIERGGDISLGDAWGSSLDENIKKQGISLILCQTQKGLELINNSNLHLENVNINDEIQANTQLRHPMSKNWRHDLFFFLIKHGMSVNATVNLCFINLFIKKQIKKLLKI